MLGSPPDHFLGQASPTTLQSSPALSPGALRNLKHLDLSAILSCCGRRIQALGTVGVRLLRWQLPGLRRGAHLVPSADGASDPWGRRAPNYTPDGLKMLEVMLMNLPQIRIQHGRWLCILFSHVVLWGGVLWCPIFININQYLSMCAASLEMFVVFCASSTLFGNQTWRMDNPPFSSRIFPLRHSFSLGIFQPATFE